MSTSAAGRAGEGRGRGTAVAVLMPTDSARGVGASREEAGRAGSSRVDGAGQPGHRGERLVGQLVVGETFDLVAGIAELAVAAVVAVPALLAQVPAAAVGLGDRLVLGPVEVDAVA